MEGVREGWAKLEINLTSLFRKIKYIWMKMKTILVAGVRASRIL